MKAYDFLLQLVTAESRFVSSDFRNQCNGRRSRARGSQVINRVKQVGWAVLSKSIGIAPPVLSNYDYGFCLPHVSDGLRDYYIVCLPFYNSWYAFCINLSIDS